jgi:glycosyltransferase involved in cell wall biosynthesis
MRLGFVALFQAYPPTSGVAAVVYGCAAHMPCDAVLVQCGDSDSRERLSDRFEVVTVGAAFGSRLGKLRSMRTAVGRIVGELSASGVDAVVVGGSWAGYLLLVESEIRRRLPGVRVFYHAHNVEYALRKEQGRPLVAEATRFAEAALLRRCDMSFAVSDLDRSRFVDLYGRQVGVLPNGAECGAPNAVAPERVEEVKRKYGIGPRAVLFMGLYAYPPNQRSVDFLRDAVMPGLTAAVPDATLVITGGDIPFHAPWLVNPGVIPRDDLWAVLKACRVGVAPVFSGSGTRLKILEYMAAGLPVVSTRKGAEGLQIEAGKHFDQAETGDDFIRSIRRILEDREYARSLTEQASARVQQQYDWEVVSRDFFSAIGGAGQGNPPAIEVNASVCAP